MTALADPPRPVMDELTVVRLRDGRPVEEALWVEFHPAFVMLRAAVVIGKWDAARGTFDHRDRYELDELDPVGTARRFAAHRPAERLARLPLGGDRRPSYDVVVPVDHPARCDCRGYAAARSAGGLCKHAHAVAWVVQSGHWPRPVPSSPGDE